MDIHRLFGTDKSVPYEHVGRHPVQRTFRILISPFADGSGEARYMIMYILPAAAPPIHITHFSPRSPSLTAGFPFSLYFLPRFLFALSTPVFSGSFSETAIHSFDIFLIH